MFKYPYDTTPCQGIVLKEIVSGLQASLVNGELLAVQTGKSVAREGLYEVPPYIKAIAPFSHPIQFDHFGKSVFVIDTRPFTRALREGGVHVAMTTEHELAVMRVLLSKHWADHGTEDFHRLGDLPARAFIRLLSEAIVRRLGLNMQDQRDVVLATAYYYYSMFTDQPWPEQEMYKLAGKIGRVTQIPADYVITSLEKLSNDGVLQPLAKIDDLIATIKLVCPSSRVELLNLTLLWHMLGGVWFGAAAREVVAVGLEHPPTWVALVYMAFTDRSYHNTLLSKLILQTDRNGLGKDFVKNLMGMLETD